LMIKVDAKKDTLDTKFWIRYFLTSIVDVCYNKLPGYSGSEYFAIA